MISEALNPDDFGTSWFRSSQTCDRILPSPKTRGAYVRGWKLGKSNGCKGSQSGNPIIFYIFRWEFLKFIPILQNRLLSQHGGKHLLGIISGLVEKLPID